MFLAYATCRGRTLIDRRLYLPTSWTDDRERCRQAGIDDSVAFETKVAMVRRAIADRIPFGWVTAVPPTVSARGWRSEMEQADVFHVMAIARHDAVVTCWALDHPVASALSLTFNLGVRRDVRAFLWAGRTIREGGW